MFTQETGLTDDFLDSLHGKLIVAREPIGLDFMDCRGMAQAVVDRSTPSGFDIPVDVRTKGDAVAHAEGFKPLIGHPDVIFLAVKHFAVKKHPFHEEVFEAEIVIIYSICPLKPAAT